VLRTGPLTVALAFTSCQHKANTTIPPVPVTVARVEQRSVPFDLNATGTVEPLQTVQVQSQVGGVLTRVAFKEGDEVKEGQVLYEIDPRPYRAALAQAEGMLARDVAQLGSANADVQRYQALVAKDYVTAQQMEQVRTTAAALNATVEADRAAVNGARLNLEFATIRAPISGRAGSLLVKEGNLIRANASTPLVTINQIRPILVRFAVPDAALPYVRQYAIKPLPVRASAAGAGGATSSGSLSFLDNAVDTTTGTILLKGMFDNTDAALWPGEFVNVTLQLYTQANAVVVPARAIVQGQQGTYVFVIDNKNAANQRPVTVERMAGDIAVVQKGLTPGEVVVTDGQLRLTTGSKVDVKGVPPAPAENAG
jgi:multidrug efflux system membrane fusion protein